MSQPKQEEEPKEKIDPNRIIELNKKIAELKKKIQLAGRFCENVMWIKIIDLNES